MAGPEPAQWDAVVTADAPDVPGDEVHFVTLADGSIRAEWIDDTTWVVECEPL